MNVFADLSHLRVVESRDVELTRGAGSIIEPYRNRISPMPQNGGKLNLPASAILSPHRERDAILRANSSGIIGFCTISNPLE
jgi:hypothetical protein